MADKKPDYVHQRWAKDFEELDRQIGEKAVICQVRILDPGVIERVIKNDRSVCGAENAQAFDKLRSLVMMHYSLRDKALVRLGQQETLLIMDEIFERLRERFGESLGGPTV